MPRWLAVAAVAKSQRRQWLAAAAGVLCPCQDRAPAATTLSRGALLAPPCGAAEKKVPLFHAPGRT